RRAGVQALGEGEHVPPAEGGARQRDELLGERLHERGREGGHHGVQGEARAGVAGEGRGESGTIRVGGGGAGTHGASSGRRRAASTPRGQRGPERDRTSPRTACWWRARLLQD